MRISNSFVLLVLSAAIIIVSMFPFTFDVGFAFGVDDEAAASTGCIVINEVMYDPKAIPDADHEWIELYNTCNETINLVGWKISDNVSSDNIPTVTIIPYGFVVIAAKTNFTDDYPGFNGSVVFINGSIGSGLNNTGGDRITIKDSTGIVIDEMSYGSNAVEKEGNSLERSPVGCGGFIDNSNPTPGFGWSEATTTPTPTPEASPTPSPTPASSPTPEPTPTPSSTPEPSPTPEPTVTPMPTPIPTITPTCTPTASPVATPTPVPSPSATPGGTVASRGDVFINEVQYNPLQSGADTAYEWLELYNNCSEMIELVGWGIRDNGGYDVIPSMNISAHGFAVLAATDNFSVNFQDYSGAIEFVSDGRIGNGLGNEGDLLVLTDSSGDIIDELSYGSDITINTSWMKKVGEGHSMERQPAGGSFIDNSVPTPGSGLPATTPTTVPTPSPVPSPTATSSPAPSASPSPMPTGTVANRGDILINEVQYNPPQSGADAAYEWVELYNMRNEMVKLVGWEIRDNGGYDLVPSLNISPHGFVIIAASENFSANFPNYLGEIVFVSDGRIGNGLGNEGDFLVLTDSRGYIIDELSYGSDTTINASWMKKVGEGHSMERQPAGGEFIDNAEPTPGRGLPYATPTPTANPTLTPTPSVSPTPVNMPQGTVANRSAILINEVQSNPLQSGSDSSYEWIELFNPGTESVELIGWGISDNYEMDGIPSLNVSANGFVLVAASENFSVNFPNYSGTLVFTADGRIGNGLGNAGDRLTLKDSAGTIIDEMSYGDDESITSPSYPSVADGHSLERAPCGGQFIDNEKPTPGSCLPSYNQTLALTPSPSPVSALTQITPESNSSGSININQSHSTDIFRSVSSMAHKSSSFDPSVESPGTSLRSLFITLSSALIVILAWMLYRQKAR
jgi:hypothetical protein